MNPQSVMAARERFAAEKLLPYRGRWVAFDEEIRDIVADAETLERLEAVLAEKRLDPQTVYLEYVPGPGDEMFVSPETAHEVRVSE